MWITLCSVLSRSYSSVLLNTYFRDRTVTSIATLEEIVNSDDINVWADNKKTLEIFNYTNPNTYKILTEKANRYDKIRSETRNTTNKRFFVQQLQNLAAKKTVHLDVTSNIDSLIAMFPNLRLTKANEKFSPYFTGLLMHKSHQFSQNITNA